LAKTLSAEAGNVNGFKKNRILGMHSTSSIDAAASFAGVAPSR
jgi:hypothetical protein